MALIKIESKDNTLVKQILKLAKYNSYRQERELAVAYGEHLIIEALRYNKLETLVIFEQSIDKYNALLKTINNSIKIYVVDKHILTKINILDNATDILGLVKINYATNLGGLYNSDVILLENIQEPGNLGAIMRVACASDINAIGLIGNCVDVYNPKVLRASQGFQFGLSIYPNLDIIELIYNYKGNIIATTPNASKLLYGLNLKQQTAFIFGNEGGGLSKKLLDLVKIRVKIPMANGTDSLNIAMATTVCAFELVRQRICG